MKIIKIVNLILFSIIIILILNLIQPLSTLTGNIVYNFDSSQPHCYFYNHGETNEIPTDRCCYEIQKQLLCEPEKESLKKCYTSESSQRYYLVNNKAYNYCQKEGYDVN